MANRLKNLWARLWQSLGFLPGVIVAGFAVLGIALVELDHHVHVEDVSVVFQGDDSAARTVLQVIAGSLITVAGLTFSITMVVLQLASSQFSPRILRTFFSDRLTQTTLGIYVGTFVYALLVLRSVSSASDVPRLSMTLASLLGIAAVILLVVFINHVAKMIQVSALTARIAHDSLARTDVLYPQAFGEPGETASGDELLARWRDDPSGTVLPPRPGYVQRVGVTELVEELGDAVQRLAILVRPGDFVSVEMPIAELWPPEAADQHAAALREAVAIDSERDLAEDVDFGLRQLTDTALRAISPAVNDPMTAVTCIGYVRSILVRLTERATPRAVRELPERGLTVVARQRDYGEYLDVLLQLNRYVAGDAWVGGELLRALRACAETARRCGAQERLGDIRGVAATVAEQVLSDVGNARDRESIEQLAAEVEALAAGAVLR
ncbi:MAG TPA: DUF2254 domain-containing protein [Baekduia sp.]|nr:DUF2254 domain-containing protein [Baekduia sp.]